MIESLVVGLLGVLNAVRLSTHERRRECAVLRAVGMTRRQLLQMVVAEASGLTGIGVVMGLALAAATLYGMIGSFSLLIAPFAARWLVAAICGGLVATAAIGAIAPARTAAQVAPALAAAEAAG